MNRFWYSLVLATLGTSLWASAPLLCGLRVADANALGIRDTLNRIPAYEGWTADKLTAHVIAVHQQLEQIRDHGRVLSPGALGRIREREGLGTLDDWETQHSYRVRLEYDFGVLLPAAQLLLALETTGSISDLERTRFLVQAQASTQSLDRFTAAQTAALLAARDAGAAHSDGQLTGLARARARQQVADRLAQDLVVAGFEKAAAVAIATMCVFPKTPRLGLSCCKSGSCRSCPVNLPLRSIHETRAGGCALPRWRGAADPASVPPTAEMRALGPLEAKDLVAYPE